MDRVTTEQTRLTEIHDAIEKVATDRAKEITRHDNLTREMEKERLDAVDWKVKNDLASKLAEHSNFNPRKYLVEFQNAHNPYFGIVGIDDNKVGKRTYIFGKQSLANTEHKVLICDWRQSEVSRFYYDYLEPGEDYIETIQGIDREGVITQRDTVTIEKRLLTRIATHDDVYEIVEGEWRKNGSSFTSTIDIKTRQKDFRLTDIIPLIDADQFHLITDETDGCLHLIGPAGAGKTSVAVHRLSFLQFNRPELFRIERSMVIAFNTTLVDYLKKTTSEILGQTKVINYHKWAISALQALGVNVDKLVLSKHDPFQKQKKNSNLPGLLVEYFKGTSYKDPLTDLWTFLADSSVSNKLFHRGSQTGKDFLDNATAKLNSQSREVTYSDIPIMLRLCQLRSRSSIVEGAVGWYDHVVIDEGQDLSLIDLATILVATSSSHSITLCSDENQRILDFVDSTGIQQFTKYLTKRGLSLEPLQVSYRCGRKIMELASGVLGKPTPFSKNPDEGIVNFHYEPSFDLAITKLRSILQNMQASEPNTLIAIICKRKTDARTIHARLAGIPGLQAPEQIVFEPGICVVTPYKIKGLDLPRVVLWNPSSNDYHQTTRDGNLLYTAISRAAKEVAIIHYEPLAERLRALAPEQVSLAA